MAKNFNYGRLILFPPVAKTTKTEYTLAELKAFCHGKMFASVLIKGVLTDDIAFQDIYIFATNNNNINIINKI